MVVGMVGCSQEVLQPVSPDGGSHEGPSEDASRTTSDVGPPKSVEEVLSPERRVTVASGLYGLVQFAGDVVGSDGTLSSGGVADHDVYVYRGDTVLKAVEAAPLPVASAKTDKHGFYEIALEPGAWQVCAAWTNGGRMQTGECARFNVAANGRVRADYCLCMREAWTVDGEDAKSSSTSR